MARAAAIHSGVRNAYGTGAPSRWLAGVNLLRWARGARVGAGAGASLAPMAVIPPPDDAGQSWAASAAVGASGRVPVGVLVLHAFAGTPQAVRGLAEALAMVGLAVSLPRLPGHGAGVDELAATG